MKLNRHIKLTKVIRQEIADNVQLKWLAENPRPLTTVLHINAANLKELDAWKKDKDSIRSNCINALDTFVSLNQLDELWPEILPFTPAYIIDPSKEFKLP